MSRGNSGGYGHRIRKVRDDEYEISWRYDNHYGGLRFPRSIVRDTNLKGAQKFAKKWGVALP